MRTTETLTYWTFDASSKTLAYDFFRSELNSASFDQKQRTVTSYSSVSYQNYFGTKYQKIKDKWDIVGREKMEWIDERKKFRHTTETLMPDGSWKTEVEETDNQII